MAAAQLLNTELSVCVCTETASDQTFAAFLICVLIITVSANLLFTSFFPMHWL